MLSSTIPVGHTLLQLCNHQGMVLENNQEYTAQMNTIACVLSSVAETQCLMYVYMPLAAGFCDVVNLLPFSLCSQ